MPPYSSVSTYRLSTSRELIFHDSVNSLIAYKISKRSIKHGYDYVKKPPTSNLQTQLIPQLLSFESRFSTQNLNLSVWWNSAAHSNLPLVPLWNASRSWSMIRHQMAGTTTT